MKTYMEKYRGHFLLMGVFVFLLHGAKLNSNNIGIDTEDLIRLEQKFYGGWLGTGRQGLVFLKGIFGNIRFNPYFTALVTLLLFAAAVASFFLLWDRLLGTADGQRYGLATWALGGILWISHPVITEQFYFSLQSMEICMGFLLTALALYLASLWPEKRRLFLPVGSVLLLLITFSCYQVFVVLFIFGAVTSLLLQLLSALAGKRELVLKDIFYRLGTYVAVFLAAFFSNMIITGLFFSSSDYLQEQILWGTVPFSDNLRAVAGHVVRVFTGYDSVFYHGGYGVLCLTALLLLIRFLRQSCKGRKAEAAMLVFLYFALLLMPFLMTIVIGGAPVLRSQLVLPVATGFMAYLNVTLFRLTDFAQKRAEICLASFLFLVCAVCGIGQTQITESLYYTDRQRYEQDVAMGERLIERLEQVNEWGLPVAVVGKKEFKGNHACVMGEVIGKSFFDYDTYVEPLSYWSTRRILGFLHILGADYEQLPEQRMEEALEYSTYMPEWPAEDSVQIFDDMVVVKLSHYEVEE